MHQVTPPAVAGRSSMRPFVGRVQELADLASALEEAASGRGSLVLLTGEPGIGKTRLMSEFARVAGQHGVRVVTGRCWEEGGAPPYWPWMQVVRSVGGDLERLAAPADSHAGRRGAASAVVPEGERIRLFDAVGRFLAAASAERAAPRHARRRPRRRRAVAAAASLPRRQRSPRPVSCSWRPTERRRSGSASSVTSSPSSPASERRIPLRGLTSADLEAYVGTVTGSQADAPSRRATARDHRRQPLLRRRDRPPAGGRRHAREPRRDDQGPLPPHPGGGPSADPPPRGEPDAARRSAVLRVAAVIGREFDLHLLQRTSRLTPARLLAVLGEAAAVGVIAELPSTPRRYSFAHELVRETLYDDLPSGAPTRAPPGGGSPARERVRRRPRSASLGDRAAPLSRGAARRRRPGARVPGSRRRPRVAALRLRGSRGPLSAGARAARARRQTRPASGAASSCCASPTRNGARETGPRRGRPSRRRSKAAAGSGTASCSRRRRWAT